MSTDKQLVIASNDSNPIKAQFIATLHQAALHQQLGYMDGLDPETKEVVPLLVGVEYDDNNKPVHLWPLGIVFLDGSNLKNYLAPDGNGNYYDQNVALDANGEPIDTDIDYDGDIGDGTLIDQCDSPKKQRRKAVKSGSRSKRGGSEVGADDDRDVSGGSV